MYELVGRVVPPGARVKLYSDEHRAYPVALRALSDRTIHHTTTSSKALRTTSNPLFPVNLADLLLRHSWREPQAGDDCVFQAPPECLLPDGHLDGLAQLHQERFGKKAG